MEQKESTYHYKQTSFLHALPYYHGWLPLNKCKVHLREDGDFLLRREQYSGTEYFVITVLANKVLYSYCMEHDREHYKWFRLLPTAQKSKDLSRLISELQDRDHPIDPTHKTYLKKPIASVRAKILSHTYEKLTDEPLHNPFDRHFGVMGYLNSASIKMNNKDRLYAMRFLKPNFLLHKCSDESLHETAELRLMLKHKNIDIIHSFLQLEEQYTIVSEWYTDGSLAEILAFGKPNYSTKTKLSFSRQILDGIAYLHNRTTPIIHTNLSARNIYIVKEMDTKTKEYEQVVKIADFWPYKLNVYNKEKPYACRNYRWFAPETIESGVFDTKTDMWSFGVTVWEIFHEGQRPYGTQINSSEEKLLYMLRQNKRLSTDLIPIDIRVDILTCWFWKPDMRPEAKDIIKKLDKAKGQIE